MLLGAAALPLLADADPKARLVFVGWTRDLQHSVWLTVAQPGVFDLKAAQYNQTIDFWTQDKAGVRLSVSFDRQEYGGTHNLFTQITDQYSQYENFVDSADQHPGRPLLPNTLPPNLPTWPTEPEVPGNPGGGGDNGHHHGGGNSGNGGGNGGNQGGGEVAPPTGVTPEIPQGVQSPVATLPPGGVTPARPTMPGAVTPPVGKLPPVSGVTPDVPQGVQSPVATLPPSGVTPSRPTMPGVATPPVGTLPPVSGVTPEIPQGVQPPIPTLPPVGGVTPEIPQGVQPPIATLPPSGVTPSRPTMPGAVTPPVGAIPPVGGVTPEIPQGVQPPIATLPPVGGVTPGIPQGVQPPVVTLPPVNGVTPEVPGRVQPPVAKLPPTAVTPTRPTIPEVVTPPIGTVPPANGVTPELPQGVQPPIAGLPGRPDVVVPPIETLPPGVALNPSDRVGEVLASEQATPREHGWNVWTDNTYLDISDHQSAAGAIGATNLLTFGADTTVRSGLILGFTLGWERAHTKLYDGAIRIESDGFNTGPYLAWQFSETCMLDAALSYGKLGNDQKILVLDGSYDTDSATANVGITGNYRWERWTIRPRLSISYEKNWSDAYSLHGDLAGIPVDAIIPDDDYDTGTASISVEFSRVDYVNGRLPLMSFLNLGADYAFQRYQKGDTLSGDISDVRTSSWAGTARLGVRALVTPATTLTLGGGYTSIGQQGLDIYEWRLYLSHAF